jgi:hypothetical protein
MGRLGQFVLAVRHANKRSYRVHHQPTNPELAMKHMNHRSQPENDKQKIAAEHGRGRRQKKEPPQGLR